MKTSIFGIAVAILALGSDPIRGAEPIGSSSDGTLLLAAASVDVSDALTPPRTTVVSGLLMCLDCGAGAHSLERCAELGHRHGLLVQQKVYEIRPATEEVRRGIYSDELFGKTITVRGRLFRSRGAAVIGGLGTIAADEIVP